MYHQYEKDKGCTCTLIFRIVISVLVLYTGTLSTYNFLNKSKCDCHPNNSTLKLTESGVSLSYESTNVTSTGSSVTNDPSLTTLTPTLTLSNEPTIDPTYIALINIIKIQNASLQALIVKVNDIETGNNEIPTFFTLGSIPNGSTSILTIPTTNVPDNAKKIQYCIETRGESSCPDSDIIITTTVLAHNRSYTHRYLYDLHSWNSDNAWFPMPSDRRITVTTSGKFCAGSAGSMSVLGYSL